MKFLVHLPQIVLVGFTVLVVQSVYAGPKEMTDHTTTMGRENNREALPIGDQDPAFNGRANRTVERNDAPAPVAKPNMAGPNDPDARGAMDYRSDNTGRNMRDANPNRVTASDQGNRSSDIEVLARIRKELVANDNLSVYGKNVKVMVENGTIVLRGPVRSTEERISIEKTANDFAAGYKVVSQLEISKKG